MNDLVLNTGADKTNPAVNSADETNPPVNNLFLNTDPVEINTINKPDNPKEIVQRLIRSKKTTPLLFLKVATAAAAGIRRRRNTQQR